MQGSTSALLCNDRLGEVIVGGSLKFLPIRSSSCASAVGQSTEQADPSSSGLGGGMGIAMLDLQQGTWRTLAGAQGVVGGLVLSITTSGDDLFVGGDFVSVAGVAASGLAVCKRFRHAERRRWSAVAAVDGPVRSIIAI